MARGTQDNKHNWQTLSLATERLLATLDCSADDESERRNKKDSEEQDDEDVHGEITRIKSRIAFLNWIEFALHRHTQRKGIASNAPGAWSGRLIT